ncbi:hypothetical protein [Rhodococcus sp. HNM0569]|uniref:hypothetical protein n=1 Tax=Rhodococcus sp. HNM0569 TaxID=2716340 RepID=UPI00146F2325|nr:hypothetical protein [Rhodococcus sp. HNM0569]NLU83332.1 hypothetical protein [Rhodococcus sp. HNM0569]
MVVAGLVSTIVLATPAGHAQPTDSPAPAPGTTQLGLGTLGLGEDITFRGNQDQVSLAVPVPQGLSPTALTGTVDLPANLARGWIDVVSDDRTLARVELPASPTASGPITIPLTGARIDTNAVVVELRLTLLPLDGICPDDWSGRSVTLHDVAVGYDGTATNPTVVADFLPPVLEQLRVYVPPSPDAAEADGAVEAAAALVAHYGNQHPRVELRPLPADGRPDLADSPFSRSVVILRGDEAATELVPVPEGPAALALRGDGDQLTDQVRLLTSNVSALAVDSKATAGSMDAPPELRGDGSTFADLGIGTLTSTSHGRVQVSASINQDRIGHAVRGMRVHLQGNYTPLPASQSGLITVSVGNDVLASWAADASGQIDRWVEIPDADLERNTTLDVTLETTGATTQCGLEQPITLTLLPQSQVRTDPAEGGGTSGFQALPQALEPAFDVAGSEGDFDDLARAVSIVTGLQSITTARLEPTWVPMEEAVSSERPAVLVIADGQIPDGIDLPLDASQDTTLELTYPDDGGRSTVTLGSGAQFASLQTTWDGTRQLVVADATSVPTELDRTLDWLAADPQRWPGLTGDILFTAQGREPVELSLQQQAVPPTDAGTSGVVRAVLVSVAVLVVVGIALAIWFTRRRPGRSAQ